VQERRVVFFHIGGHKTGTTYLQNVLWQNRVELRAAGTLYPGTHPASHVWANFDLRETGFRGYRPRQVNGAWDNLVAEIRAWQGPSIIDHEMFSLAKPAHIERAISDLAFAEVQVIFTARDMARQLPAAWQEWLKNRSTTTYAEFLAAVCRPEIEETPRFWGLHDVPGILERWAATVGADHVHVITLPPPGGDRSLLWRRFADVVGIDAEGYDLETAEPNTSLGAAEAALLRRVNLELGGTLSWPEYNRRVKFGLAPALAARPGPRIELPTEAYEWAVSWAKDAIQRLSAGGYRVVGDLDELVPTIRQSGLDPDRIDVTTLADTAIAGLAVALKQGRGGRARPGGKQGGAPVAPPVEGHRPTGAAVQRFARRVAARGVRRLRRW
jgi:hypothetical protein